MSPFAAAAIGFGGMSDVSHRPNVCPCAPASWLAASAAPDGNAGCAPPPDGNGNRANRLGASGTTTAATHASNSTNTSSVRPPRRPIEATSAVDAIPVTSRETISGITVIRMAFTHNVPIGAMASAPLSAAALPDAEMATPPMTAAPSATTIRVPSFICRGVCMERRLHHQVAAGDVDRRAGHVAGFLGGEKANQVRDLDRGAESRNRETRGESLQQLG